MEYSRGKAKEGLKRFPLKLNRIYLVLDREGKNFRGVTKMEQTQEKQWYAISIHKFRDNYPTFEKTILQAYADKVDDVVIPKMVETVHNKGKKEDVTSRMFGNYIFIHANMDVYLIDALKDTTGISIVYPITPLDPVEIEQYREVKEVKSESGELLGDGEIEEENLAEFFDLNDRVYLTTLGVEGFVQGTKGNKVLVEVDILGTNVVEVDPVNVEKCAEE